MRNHAEPSEAQRRFRPLRGRSYPEGKRCYCADQDARRSGRHHPAGRPAARQDRKADRTAETETGVARPVFPLRPGERDKPRRPGCSRRQRESQEVRPVAQGQRPVTNRSRPCGTGDDAHALQACSHRVRRAAPGRERPIGRRGLTQKIPAGNGRDGPAMRPKHPPAAESGVGEHTARESESA